VEVAVLEELGVECILNARARAGVELGADRVEVGRVGCVPQSLTVLLNEIRIAVDVGGDLLGDRVLEADAGLRGWLDQGERGRAGLVAACWLQVKVSELLDAEQPLGMAARRL